MPTCSWSASGRARDRARARARLRRLRCGRDDRAGHPDPRAAPARRGRRCRTSRAGSTRATACRWRRSTRRRRPARRVIVTVDCGSTSVAEVAAANAARDRRPHHRPPPRPGRPARRPSRSSTRTGRCDLPGPAAGRQRRRVQARAAAPRATCPAAGRGPGPGGPRGDRDRRGRRAGRSARTGRSSGSGWSGCAPAPRPGHRRAPRRGAVAPGDRRPRDGLVRHRAAAERGRPGGGGVRRRAAPAQPRPGRGGAMLADALEAANVTRRDLMKTAVAEARGRRRTPSTTRRRPSCAARGRVGIVGLVAARLAEERGRPAVVGAELGDVVRASCRSAGGLHLADDARAPARDLFIRHGGHAGAAGFEIEAERWPEFRERFLALAAAAAPPDPAPPIAIDLALPARDVDYALHRDLAAARAVRPGQPRAARRRPRADRDAGPRAATGGHTQLTLKRRLDVLDGIAFGWPELAETVAEGDVIDVVAQLRQPALRRLRVAPAGDPRRGAVGHHPEAGAILGGRPWPSGRSRPGSRRQSTAVDRGGPDASRPRDPCGAGAGRPAAATPVPAPSVVGLRRSSRRHARLLGGDLPFVGDRAGTATAATAGAARDADAVERRRRPDAARRRSRARSSTRRPATSGSRRASDATPADDAAATIRCRRGRRTASAIYFVRTADEDGPLAVAAGSSATYELQVPSIMRINADGSGDPPSAAQRPGQSKRPAPGPTGSASRSLSPDGAHGRDRLGRPGPDAERRRRSSSSTSSTRKLDGPEARRDAALGHQDPTWRRTASPPLRPQRPRRAAGRAGDLSLQRRQGQARRALTGPGYLEPVVLAGTAGTSRRRRRAASAPTSSILDAGTGRGAAARHQRRAVVQPGLVAEGRRDRVLPHRAARSSTCTWCRSTARPPTGRSRTITDLTEVSGLDARIASGLVHPGRPAARRSRRRHAVSRPRAPAVRRARERDGRTYLERLAARSAAVGHGPVPRPRSRSGDAAGRASRRTSPGSSDSPACSSRPPRRSPPPSSRTSRSSRPSGRLAGGPRAGPGADPGRTSRSSRMPSGPTSDRPRRARRSRSSTSSARTPSRSARTSARPAIAPLPRARRPVRLRPVPDVQPRRRRDPGPASWRPDPAIDAARRAAARSGSPRHVAGWGPGGTVGLVVGATAPDGAARRPGDRRPAWRSSCRASARRAATIEPVLRDGSGDRGARPVGPAGRRPRGQRLARRSRSAAGDPGDGGPRDPGERLAAAAADWAATLPVLP